ncbi:hypothetical protein PVAND_014582 [Polypedilum vanderplanki]|uniref:Zinc finger protein n=1 Tax=Polypedilum vanderplanki TaxID=319348 RepID=A0A9J6B9T5_POLVA|nr:hypothetical protein PVAND_014582 [Polypedilum vanderplanki]
MSNLCRVCVTESFDTVDLNEYRDGLPISVIVMIILPVKIHQDEDFSLPKKICGNCLEIILNAYNLRSVSLNSEQILKTNEFYIKKEVIENPVEVVEIKNKKKITKHFDEPEEVQNEEIFSDQFSIDFYKKDKSPKASIGWRYFGRLLNEYQQQIDTDYNYCSLCLKQKKITKYKNSSATSTILLHLQTIHGIGRQKDGSEMITNKVKEKYKQRTKTADKSKAKNSTETTGTICSSCGKSFSNHHILNKHLKIHSGQSFSCDSCPAKFTYLENLQRHQKVHDPNHFSQYVCDTCGNGYAELKSLKNHIMRIHLNIPPEKKFSCTFDGCSMKFAKRYNLKKHMMTHLDMKPHECQYCGTAYASKGDLFKHLQKNHVGNALYNCEYCSASFRLKIQLRDHYKIHYKNDSNDYTEAESSGISNL